MNVKCLAQCLAQLILEKYWLFPLPSSSSNFIQLFTNPMEKKCTKAKWLSWEALQIAVKEEKQKAKKKRKDISI